MQGLLDESETSDAMGSLTQKFARTMGAIFNWSRPDKQSEEPSADDLAHLLLAKNAQLGHAQALAERVRSGEFDSMRNLEATDRRLAAKAAEVAKLQQRVETLDPTTLNRARSDSILAGGSLEDLYNDSVQRQLAADTNLRAEASSLTPIENIAPETVVRTLSNELDNFEKAMTERKFLKSQMIQVEQEFLGHAMEHGSYHPFFVEGAQTLTELEERRDREPVDEAEKRLESFARHIQLLAWVLKKCKQWVRKSKDGTYNDEHFVPLVELLLERFDEQRQILDGFEARPGRLKEQLRAAQEAEGSARPR